MATTSDRPIPSLSQRCRQQWGLLGQAGQTAQLATAGTVVVIAVVQGLSQLPFMQNHERDPLLLEALGEMANEIARSLSRLARIPPTRAGFAESSACQM
jgi:hypothetical protein